MEFLDIIDINNIIVGQATKEEAHTKGLRHRVIAILLRRDDGKFLISTPTQEKLDKGLIHSVAGHVSSRETYYKAAVREMREELSLNINEKDLHFLKADWYETEYGSSIIKERFELFLVKYYSSMGSVVLNDESSNELWLSKDDLLDIYENDRERLSKPLQYICKEILPTL